jgi:hypothetical protein
MSSAIPNPPASAILKKISATNNRTTEPLLPQVVRGIYRGSHGSRIILTPSPVFPKPSAFTTRRHHLEPEGRAATAAHRSAVLDESEGKAHTEQADDPGKQQEYRELRAKQDDRHAGKEQKGESEIHRRERPGPSADARTLAATALPQAFPVRHRSANPEARLRPRQSRPYPTQQMKRAFLVAVAALSIVSPAAAKSNEMTVCGASGCATIPAVDHRFADALLRWGDPEFVTPPAIGAYFELKSEMLSPEGLPAYFVPSRRAIKASFTGRPEWIASRPGAEAALRASLPNLRPWPAPKLTRVFIGAREATKSDPYLHLFDDFPAPPPLSAKRVPIVLRSERPSPWTDGYNRLEFAPGKELLHRGDGWVQLPTALSEQIKRDGGLIPPNSTSGFPWAIVGGLLGALAVSVGAVTLTRMRRRRHTPGHKAPPRPFRA